MKKLLLFLCYLSLIGFTSKGQAKNDRSYIEIGDGVIQSSNPLYTSWNYSWSNFLYHSSNLGDAKTITKIAFYASKDNEGNVVALTNQKLYLKLGAATTAGTSYPDPENNGYTKVWEGTFTYPGNGPQWVEIDINDFEYDGSSNLLVHWQNNSGTSSYNTSFYGTSVTGCATNSGSDSGFPSNGTAYNSYQDALPNMRVYYMSDGPDTPEAIEPLNASIKVDVDTDISFSLANASSYDFYLGTSATSLEKVASDVSVSADGNYSFKSSELLKSKTNYYWKVIAKDANSETASPVFNFQTQKIIEAFPFECDFESYWITFLGDTLSSIINTNYPDSSDWSYSNGWSGEITNNAYQGLMAGKVSAWSAGDYTLTSPRFNMSNSAQLSFYWRNNYFSESKGTGNSKAYVSTYVEISTNGGKDWNELGVLTPTTDMLEYVYVSYDLSAYLSDNVYIRWRYHETNDSNLSYFWLDNIKVSEVSNEAEIELSINHFDFPEICTGAESSVSVIIRNLGASVLNVNLGSSDGPFETDFSGSIEPGLSDTAVVYFRPLTAGSFSNTFTFITNAGLGNETLTLTGSAYAPMTDFFQGFDLIQTIPEKWGVIKSAWDQYSGVQITQGAYEVFSAPYAVKMLKLNDSISPIMLVSPGVTNFDVNSLTFVAKKAFADYELILEVGTLANPNDPETFTVEESFNLTDEFQSYSVQFKESNTIPYIAFKHASETPMTSLRLDDIAWEPVSSNPPNPAVIASPADDASSVDIMMHPVLKWANGGGAPTGYKISIGTNNPPTNVVNAQELSLSDLEYEVMADLEFNTKYYWQVVPFNQYGDCPDAPVWSFTSMSDPTISSLPFTEGFNSLVNVPGQKDYPLGWSYEDVSGDNVTWDVLMANPGIPGLTKDQAAMHIAFHIINPKDDYLYTPPISLNSGKTYNLSFWIHTIEDMVLGYVFKEEIEVKIGTKNNSSFLPAEPIAYAYVDDEEWKQVNVQFTVDTDDAYFIAFHAISEPAYILILDDVELTEVENTNTSPGFTSEPVDTARVGQLYTYQIKVSDAENDDLTISATEKPEWLSFTDNGNGTALLTGTPTENGTVNVKLSVSDGELSSEQTFRIEVKPGVGIAETFGTNMRIYPNPSKGIFAIQALESVQGKVQIFNVAGSMVHQLEMNGMQAEINIHHLNNGFYYLVMPSNKGFFSYKIVKE